LPASGDHNFARIDTVFFASGKCFDGIDFLGVWLLRYKIFPSKPNFWSVLDLENFRQKTLYNGGSRSKLPLINLKVGLVNRQIGVKISKFLVVSGPYLQVMWHSACAMAIFGYITGLNIVIAITQETGNRATSYLSYG